MWDLLVEVSTCENSFSILPRKSMNYSYLFFMLESFMIPALARSSCLALDNASPVGLCPLALLSSLANS